MFFSDEWQASEWPTCRPRACIEAKRSSVAGRPKLFFFSFFLLQPRDLHKHTHSLSFFLGITAWIYSSLFFFFFYLGFLPFPFFPSIPNVYYAGLTSLET